jgi:hypothetical protein
MMPALPGSTSREALLLHFSIDRYKQSTKGYYNALEIPMQSLFLNISVTLSLTGMRSSRLMKFGKLIR